MSRQEDKICNTCLVLNPEVCSIRKRSSRIEVCKTRWPTPRQREAATRTTIRQPQGLLRDLGFGVLAESGFKKGFRV